MALRALLQNIVNLLTGTIGHLNIPYSHKKFPLDDYFKIEKKLLESGVNFAVAVVTTYGAGSNLLVKASTLVSKDKRKRSSNKTHALAILEIRPNRFRTVEMFGQGLVEKTLLSSIGNRDEVKILIPDPRYMDYEMCEDFYNYIDRVAHMDRQRNVEYDFSHQVGNSDKFDCSELIYHALEYAQKNKYGIDHSLKTYKRFGVESFSPVDIEYLEEFKCFYCSKEGFL